MFGLQVEDGDADGVSLKGAKVVMHFEMPGDFLGGIDKAKMYYDPSVTDDQRAALDAIFHGEQGGLWGGMREAIKEWLPSQVTAIDFAPDGNGVTVDGIGQVVLAPLTESEGGPPTTVSGAPVVAAFSIKTEQLAFANGTKFSDPALRSWESLGAGGIATHLVEWAS